MADITQLFEQYLLELLLGMILTFNVGAYAFLWRYIKDLENTVEERGEKMNNYNTKLMKMWNRVFGPDYDDSQEGHIIETEEEIEKIYCLLEKEQEERRREHEEVRNLLMEVVDMLSDDERIEVNREDFDISHDDD